MVKRKEINGIIKEPILRGGIYWFDNYVHNIRYRCSLKTANKTVARERALRLYEEIYNELFSIKSDITVGETLDRFLEYKKGKASHPTDVGRVKNLMEFLDPKMLLNDLNTKSQMEGIMKYLKEKKEHKKNTIKHHMALLKAAINLAKDDKVFYGDNPVRMVKLKSIKSPAVKFNLETMHQILEYTKSISDNAKTKSQQYVYPFAYIALNSGMRAGEILGLQWRDVHEAFITIREPKSGQEIEEIPNLPWLYEFMMKLPKESVYVLNTNQRKTGTFYKIWLKMKAKLKLHERSNWHSLRHSFASYLDSQNVPHSIIQILLRHADPSTTAGYIHKDFEEISEAMLKIKGAVKTGMKVVK